MRDALRESRRSLPGRLIAWKLVALLALALAVTELSLVTHLDAALTRDVHGWTAGWLTRVATDISYLAGSELVLWLTAAAMIALVWVRDWRGAAALGLAVATTQVGVAIAKVLIARPRPTADIAIADPTGWSFPSGHSASAVALYVTLGLIATTTWRLKPRRAPVFALAGTIVLLVGLSRVYLGAHYPTDVLAGWLTGGVVVVASWAACSRLPRPPPRPAAA